jgi:protein phosphatase 2C family protein 2/3
MFFAIFDGHGG